MSLDPDLRPVVEVGRPTSGPLSDSWVPAKRVTGEIVPVELQPPAVVDVERAWQPLPTATEVGTPQGRAVATVIRAAPLVLLLFPATLALVWLLEVSAWWLFPLWALSGLAAYLAVVYMDLIHNSPASTERHRIDQAARVKMTELKQVHELRRMVVEAYLRRLDKEG